MQGTGGDKRPITVSDDFDIKSLVRLVVGPPRVWTAKEGRRYVCFYFKEKYAGSLELSPLEVDIPRILQRLNKLNLRFPYDPSEYVDVWEWTDEHPSAFRDVVESATDDNDVRELAKIALKRASPWSYKLYGSGGVEIRFNGIYVGYTAPPSWDRYTTADEQIEDTELVLKRMEELHSRHRFDMAVYDCVWTWMDYWKHRQ